MRRIALILACGLLLQGIRPSRMSAQVMTQAQVDSIRADSLRRVDSLAQSIPDNTQQFLDAEQRARRQLVPLPLVGAAGILPAMSRYVFTRDSIDWATGQYLADLLARVPGVMLQVGGSFGRPQLPSYQGRGAASVEYWLDGVPFHPMGPDSAAVDPTFFALVLLERIEIERGLGQLRVHLFTRRHTLEVPRTRIGFAAGDQGIGRYSGAFEARYPSGIGLTLAGENFSINAPTGGTGGNAVTNGMLQLSYFPSPRYGAQFQYLMQAPDREALLRNTDTLSPRLKGSRSDQELRLFWRNQADELGMSVNAFLTRSAWSSGENDGSDQAIGNLGVVTAWRQPRWSSQVSVWHHTEWTPFDLTAQGGWSPNERITGSLELVAQSHTHDRWSRYVTGRLGARLPFGVQLTGMASDGKRVQSPAIAADLEQRFTDLGWTASYQRPRYSLEVGYARNDGWQPVGFRQLYRLPQLAPLPTTQWATLQARVGLYSWLTLETVYQHPLGGALPGGSPPHHALTTATVRSKFLRNFPSGIFDMRLQAAMESWSPGIAGLDAEGTPVAMPGRTFFRAVFQLQIGPFIAYYDRVNLRGRSAGYLPGYPLPALSSTFGVRWAFLN